MRDDKGWRVLASVEAQTVGLATDSLAGALGMHL
ncbi:hypothetical protein MPNT_240007 [Candidatus Methylacidithermus pantelleriae]|uniref:Uncharacterized protein n=1 Tax=Candidatus Methylacidithermus pantelleriae TaxID=2744239 RepID=A0A8J2BTI5_9BACT|nr:hypothetical protein MPNT_240007 [Candidatus Methylacidithermus pantelleriae]